MKQVLGALVFGAKEPVSVRDLKKNLAEAATQAGASGAAYAAARESEIRAAIDELRVAVESAQLGFLLVETADGYVFHSDPCCGPWLRLLKDADHAPRFSRPALETLAIIAYKQPVTRAEIEGVRGVNVDHVLRSLMEAQLVRIVGRSELPGRPLLYGTTKLFLDHFGLKDVRELPGIEQFRVARRSRAAESAATDQVGDDAQTREGGVETPDDSEDVGLAEENTECGESPDSPSTE